MPKRGVKKKRVLGRRNHLEMNEINNLDYKLAQKSQMQKQEELLKQEPFICQVMKRVYEKRNKERDDECKTLNKETKMLQKKLVDT